VLLSIHQPSYFPWLGLLDKIRNSDTYMVMDEIQLSDSAYQHRNLLLTADGKPKYLTIPFAKKNYLQRPFRELEIASDDWRAKHFNFIWNNYRKHPFAPEILPRLETYFAGEYPLLCQAVVASMQLVFELLEIQTRVIFQSDMSYDRSLKRGELVRALVDAAGADSYLSGTGARDYLDETAFSGGVTLHYNPYTHPKYPQNGTQEFQVGLSSLDMLFNVGMVGGRALLAGRGAA
jgi:hypothetical protein